MHLAVTIFLALFGVLAVGCTLYVGFSFLEMRVTGWARRTDDFALG